MLRNVLKAAGIAIGREKVSRIMKRLGIEALCFLRNTSQDLSVSLAQAGARAG
jgi:hypothetical protein